MDIQRLYRIFSNFLKANGVIIKNTGTAHVNHATNSITAEDVRTMLGAGNVSRVGIMSTHVSTLKGAAKDVTTMVTEMVGAVIGDIDSFAPMFKLLATNISMLKYSYNFLFLKRVV